VDISVPPGERALSFIGFRAKVWWGGAQVVAAAPCRIKSPWLHPHLGGDIEKFVGVVWF
jgi:hypothetical protein